MKKFKKISAILFFSAYLILGLNFATPVSAAKEVKFTPQVGIPNSEFTTDTGITVGKKDGSVVTSDLLARYVKAFYNWGLSIVGVLAVLMLMAGGLIWLTSAGDSGKIENAKKMISGSLFGTLLLVGAYFFLNTINPDLAKLPVIELSSINKSDIDTYLSCCNKTNGAVNTKIKIENGKKIAIEGSLKGKEIKCGATSTECNESKGEKCLLSVSDKYECMVDNWCCQCTNGLVFKSCKDNLSYAECNDWCKGSVGWAVGWQTKFYFSTTHKCVDNKCTE